MKMLCSNWPELQNCRRHPVQCCCGTSFRKKYRYLSSSSEDARPHSMLYNSYQKKCALSHRGMFGRTRHDVPTLPQKNCVLSHRGTYGRTRHDAPIASASSRARRKSTPSRSTTVHSVAIPRETHSVIRSHKRPWGARPPSSSENPSSDGFMSWD